MTTIKIIYKPKEVVDIAATKWSDKEGVAVSVVNKHPTEEAELVLRLPKLCGKAVMYTVNGPGVDCYNDVGREEIGIVKRELGDVDGTVSVKAAAHSVNVVQVLPG